MLVPFRYYLLTVKQIYNSNLKCLSLKKATFDAGARFGGKGGGTMNIPPPPPGYAPNAAQIAAMKGQPVIILKNI